MFAQRYDSEVRNAIATGNPARGVKQLDPNEKITPRAQWFSDPARLSSDLDQFDKALLKDNTTLHLLRDLIHPLSGK